MKTKKFTFKTSKPTGKWAWLSKPTHYIKLDKIQCGSIDHESPHKIRLQVIKKDIMEDGNKNCPWKWVKLKHESKSVDEAKEFLNKNVDVLLSMYELFLSK